MREVSLSHQARSFRDAGDAVHFLSELTGVEMRSVLGDLLLALFPAGYEAHVRYFDLVCVWHWTLRVNSTM